TEKDGLGGPAGVGEIELLLGAVEQREAVAGRRVAELVDEAREAVDRREAEATPLAQHERRDGEVLARRALPDVADPGEGVDARDRCLRRRRHLLPDDLDQDLALPRPVELAEEDSLPL